MRIDEILKFPTCLDMEYIKAHKCVGYHESLLRSYWVLNKVMELIKLDTPKEVIEELVDYMGNYNGPSDIQHL